MSTQGTNGTAKEKEVFNEEEASELEIKEYVRKRDGYKCRDCGMTREQHQQEYDRDLDVHRLVPGAVYQTAWCVTLCRKCHGKKPKKPEDALYHKDIFWVALIRYDQEHADIIRLIRNVTVGTDDAVYNYILRVLQQDAFELGKHEREDLLL